MTEHRTISDPDAMLDTLRAEEGSPHRFRPNSRAWEMTWQWVVAAAIVVLLAYLTYTRAGWVPLLSGVDFGIHEFGHLLFMDTPTLVVWLAGSALQVAVPLGLTVYFLWSSDYFASILTLGWSAESLNNVSVYMYDATRLQLVLWGDIDGSGAGHDWANIFTKFKLIPKTDAIAYATRSVSALLFMAALGLAVWGFVRARSAKHPA